MRMMPTNPQRRANYFICKNSADKPPLEDKLCESFLNTLPK